MVHYNVRIENPHAHHFGVSCTISEPDPAGQQLSLPAWIPGSYMIRDFARNILWLKAESEAGPLEIEKLDKQQWRCAPCEGPITLHYRIYAWDQSVRSAHLDQTHGFFNGTSLFLSVTGQEQTPHQVTLNAPDQLAWRVATTLPATEVDAEGWGSYHCESYDALIDYPVEMGSFERIDFSVCGIPHALILSGHQDADHQRLAADLTRICEQHSHFFGDDTPPVEQYLFLTTVVGEGYGGLEHRDSCVLICSREDLPHKGETEISDHYPQFLGLCSHEYFHLWNIKRIKPALFTPYQLQSESYTRQLWAYEGITSYFDDLALLECGLIEPDRYLQLLGQTLTRLQRSLGKNIQSVTDSSLDAWSKFYKQDENANNAIVSYYVKGAAIALMIDLSIRQQTQHQASLQQVMQQLWQQHGKSGVGTEEETIENLCRETAGGELSFLQSALYSTEPLLIEPLLQQFGIDWQLRPTTSNKDKGGISEESLPQCWLGASLKAAEGGLEVLRITDSSPAQQAGISAGDRIIALDQLQATEGSVKSALYNRAPGSTLQIHLFRRDELLEMVVTLQAAPADSVVLQQIASADDNQLQARLQWLGEDGTTT